MALPGWVQGTYQGFDPFSVQRGLDQQQSKLELTVSKDAIVVSTVPDSVGRQWKYKYSDDWIDKDSKFIQSRNSFFTTCVGLRGAADKRHILCFNRFHLGDNWAEATLHSTKNLNARTGLFFMRRLQLLEPAFWEVRRSQEPTAQDLWEPYHYEVPAFDFQEAERVMASGERAEKLRLFKKISDHLWARSPAEVDRLVSYLRLAIQDPDEVVQAMALNVFAAEDLVVQGVPLVMDILKQPLSFAPTTVQRAAAAALALLAQGQRVLDARSALKALYQTSDLDDVYKKTGGLVSAAVRSHIETILRLPEQDNTWNSEDRVRLLTSLLQDKEGSKRPYFKGSFAEMVEKFKAARENFVDRLGGMSKEQLMYKLHDPSRREVFEAFQAIRDSKLRVRQWEDADIHSLQEVLAQVAVNTNLHRSVRDTITASPRLQCALPLMGEASSPTAAH